MEAKNLAEMYSTPLLDWGAIVGRLEEGVTIVDETGLALTAEFSAPSAGPPPWHVYRLTPLAATALATVEPGGATRWRF
ncbi:MAG TPA: hypothetical protein VFQ68_23400 [Streptosporangiaceae bacterium]|nr:hypothetical protein [Streptosporangiaceae bacterium]